MAARPRCAPRMAMIKVSTMCNAEQRNDRDHSLQSLIRLMKCSEAGKAGRIDNRRIPMHRGGLTVLEHAQEDQLSFRVHIRSSSPDADATDCTSRKTPQWYIIQPMCSSVPPIPNEAFPKTCILDSKCRTSWRESIWTESMIRHCGKPVYTRSSEGPLVGLVVQSPSR